MVSLIFLSPVNKVPDIQTYVYIKTWLAVLLGSLTFILQPQTEFSTNIWGWLLEIYLWGEPLSHVTLGPLWYALW
jgi:hypothetical protein